MIETVRAGVADRADATSFVGQPDSLTCVFNDLEPMLASDRHDRVHVTHQIEHVNRHDRLGVGRDLPLDVFRIDRQAFVDVDDDRDSADHQRGDRGGHPRIGGNEDLVTGTYTCGCER